MASETGWLVEWPQSDNNVARWWHPTTGWMIDANKAMRFARKIDAEEYIANMRFGAGHIATEHTWVDGIPAPIPADGRCAICGEPMPPGETMFKFHGYSGPCPALSVGSDGKEGGDMSEVAWREEAALLLQEKRALAAEIERLKADHAYYCKHCRCDACGNTFPVDEVAALRADADRMRKAMREAEYAACEEYGCGAAKILRDALGDGHSAELALPGVTK